MSYLEDLSYKTDRPAQYLSPSWGADQNTGNTYENPDYQPWLDSLKSSAWSNKNPFATEQDYLNSQQKGNQYLNWNDYNSIWNDWNGAVGDSGPKDFGMGYGANSTPFKTANNLYSMGYSSGGMSGGTYGGGDSGGGLMEGQTWSDPSMSILRYMTEQEAPGGWALSFDPKTGKYLNPVSTHGESGGFLRNMWDNIGKGFILPAVMSYFGGQLGAGGGAAGQVAGDAYMPASIAQQGALDLGVGSAAGSAAGSFGQAASDIMGNAGSNISNMMNNPVTDTLASAADTMSKTATDAGAVTSSTLNPNGWPSVGDIGASTGNTLGTNTITSSPSWLDALKTGLTPTSGNGNLFGSGGMLDANKGLIQLGGGLYDLYAKNQIAGAQQDLANKQNALAQQGLAANQANTDAAVKNINGLYAPGSPEYNLMQQTMERQDAAAGRNSQFGSRATELAAKIAGIKSNGLANVYSSAGQTGNAAYLNALNAGNNANNLSVSALSNQYGGLSSLFSVLGSQNQDSQGVDAKTMSALLRMLLAKQGQT